MLKSFFILTTFIFSLNLVTAQVNIQYHSDYEKEVIDGYLNGHFSSLELQLIADQNISYSNAKSIKAGYTALLNELVRKRKSIKSDERFLSWMFYKVHRKTLKNYKQYSTLAQTITAGNYDCLSATTLYALLLHDLGFEASVVETTYHIYLTVNLGSKITMFESTDPLNGFISNSAEIAKRVNLVENSTQIMPSIDTYQFKNNVEGNVSLFRLTGLHYFNLAVDTFNNRELMPTISLLEKASLFYHSERITEFGMVIASALLQDKTITEEIKEQSLMRISRFLKVTESVAIN